jgi:phosphoglycolate phosphatase-like HAD superfamily hydrolase
MTVGEDFPSSGQALTALNIPPANATFLGDSTTDVQAANAAGTMSIGYTNKPGKKPTSWPREQVQ